MAKHSQLTGLILFFLSSTTALASAPAKMPPKDAAEAFKNSEIVFAARVQRTEADKFGFESKASVEPTKIWKGAQFIRGKTIQISGEGGSTYPARIFKEKQQLIFYIDRDLHADSFTNRVVPEDSAEFKTERQILDKMASAQSQ